MSETTPTPTPTTPPATTTTVTGLERAGTGITIAGVVLGVVTLALVLFGHNITISSNAQATNAIYVLVAITALGLLLGLLGTIFNVPALLKQMNTGRLTSTALSVVTLVALGVYFFVGVLPHTTNLLHLNNVVEPFGTSIQNDCQTPLSTETTHAKKIEADAKTFPNPPNPATLLVDLTNFGGVMSTDVNQFQQDLTVLQANLTKVQGLALPDGKYGALRDGCVRDIQGTIGFINDTSTVSTSNTTLFTQAIIAGINQEPASVLPTVDKQIIDAVIQSSMPTSYSALSLLQSAASFANMKATLTFPSSVPVADQQLLGIEVYAAVSAGYSALIPTVMDGFINGTDAATTNAGNCFANDIINTLNDNLKPFNVDTTKIVGQGIMTCTAS
jgi:hypothetical protein